MQVTRSFTKRELDCKCGCGRMEIPQATLGRLQELRDDFQFPMILSSAFRCSSHNQNVSSTGPNGPHTKGAFDVRVYGPRAVLLVQLAIEHGWTGIGISQKGPHEKRFVHLDLLPNAPGQPRPWIWSY